MHSSHTRQLAFESSTLPIVIMDPKSHRFVDCNPAAIEKYGFGGRFETIGKTPVDVSTELQYDGTASQERAKEYIDRVMSEGSVVFEWRHQRPDGSTWDAEVHLARFVAGEQTLLEFTLLDITNRKQVEATLRESEAQYRFLTESIRDVIWTMDVESMRYTYVSPSCFEQSGYTPREVMDAPWDNALGEETAVRIRHEIAERVRAFESGKEPYGQARFSTEEWPQVHKNGSVIWSEVVTCYRCNPVTGRMELHGVTRDITERRLARQALSESESRFRVLFERAGIAIVILNEQGVFIDCNHKAEEVFGCTTAELVGMPPWRFSPDVQRDGRPSSVCALERIVLALNRGPQVFEWIHRRLDGMVFDAEVSLSAVRTERGTVVFGFVQDVTERKRTERERETLQAQLLQAQKMEAVGRLAGGVAHDFNNLLGVIIGYTNLLLSDMPSDGSIRADIQAIEEAAQRSAVLTRQLLAFARQQVVCPRALDLNAEIERTFDMLTRIIGENIVLEFKPGRDVTRIHFDPSQLDQVLFNLCVNSRDAIKDVGRITIETSNVELDATYCVNHAGCEPGKYVQLVVSDTGCGMSSDTMSRAFEPFFTTKPLGKGTGLGLSTLWGIVSQNGGSVSVYSEPGMGTAFKIYFRQSPEYARRPEPLPSLPRNSLYGETLLYVEDEPSLRAIGVAMLEKLGYKVLSSSNPTAALNFVTTYSGPIDLLITDVIMPEMNGRQLHERLRQLKPELKCLFTSGYTADVIAHHGVLDEGVDFLSKPFTLNALSQQVYEILSRQPNKAE